MHGKFSDKFDPEEWAQIYDSAKLDPAQWIFHRGTKIAQEISLSRSSKGQYWLDVGCGTGHLANDLSAQGLKLICLDHDRSMIASAKKRFEHLNLLQGTAEQFPFHAKGFHGVIAVSVMGCFESPEKFYKEAFRILKPDGFLVFTCTNKSSLLLKMNARLKPRSKESFHLYTLAELKKDLRSNGFEIVDYGFYNFFLNPGRNPIPSLRISKSLERFSNLPGVQFAGRNFFVVAKRM